jgi:HK97 gp10 family phage protein
MNVNIKIDQSDLSKLKKKLDNLRAFESQKLSNELGKTALDIVRLAKREVKYDKGDLRKSIKSETNKTTKSVVIEALAHYAPYVEFGTGGSVDLNDMLELGIPASYAAQFKGKGIRDVNLPARPFFFSSGRIGFKNLLNRLNGEIKKAIK